ncbi:unnamed protein product [Rhizophagus irregularis]|nr:unnamed protein product [Rhizophagus irregularis]
MCLFDNYIFSLEMKWLELSIQTYRESIIGLCSNSPFQCINVHVGLCFIFVLKKLIYTRLECSIPDEDKQIRLLDFLDSALENFLYNWTFLTQL